MDVEGISCLAGRGEGSFEEELFVDIAGVEGDEVVGELGAEVVDLGQDVGHVHDVGHGRRGRPSSCRGGR